MLVVAVCYVIAGRLGLAAAMVDTNITLVWPPTGIAIAALLRGGSGLWPAVAVGAFAINCWMGAPLPVALGIAVGNTLGPVVTALLLRRLGLHFAFDRRRDAGWFCLAVIAGLAIPPSVGVACLAWSGLVEWGAAAWLLWWLGDVVGAVVVAPLLLTVKRDALRQLIDRYLAVEFLCLCIITVSLGALIFLGTRQLAVSFLALPFVLWSALRFGTWGSSLNVVLVAALATIGTANHLGPFARPGLESSLLLAAFLATAAALNLMLSALLAERTRAEDALRAGLERLRLALDHAHMATCEVNLRTMRFVWGPGADALFGSEPGAVPMTMNEFFARVHPDDHAPLQAAMAQAFAGGSTPQARLPYEVIYRVRRVDGGERWLTGVGEFIRDAAGQVVSTSGLAYDITDRREAEQTLRDSEQRHRTLIEHSPEAIVVFDVEAGRFIEANSQACLMFGLDRQALLASNLIALSPPRQPDGQPSAAMAQALIARAVAGEVPRLEWVHCNNHGVDFPCELWLVRLPSAGRTLIRASLVDIRERKLAQAALAASEERLRIAFAAAGLGAWELELASRRVTWSEDCCRLHGLTPAQAPRSEADFLALVQAEDHAPLQNALSHAIAAGTLFQCEFRIAAGDGSVRWFASFARCQYDAQGQPLRVIGVDMDVSPRHHADEARQRLEARLFHTQKLEAIGTLAGGIAHDFNNILAAIIGNLDLARGDIDRGHQIQQRLNNILSASHRARDLVRQILAFSRQQVSVRTVLRLEPLAKEVFTLLRASLPATVILELSVDPACPAVSADASQMHQVLMNLCTNSWQSLPAQRGRVTIALAPVALDDVHAVNLPDLTPGKYLRLSVSDTGAGMDSATKARIFEPFFTTKPTGQGTGLGLAVVHGIVQAHHGAIVVDSQASTGTTVHIYLPAAPTSAATSAPASAQALPSGHGEHVYYVDDESALVALSTELLSELGYRVSGFTSAAATLVALRNGVDVVDLVISDLTMPDMNGLDLARTLLEERPDLPVVLATGYPGDLTQEQIQTSGIRALMIKPAMLDSLAAIVHEHVRRRG